MNRIIKVFSIFSFILFSSAMLFAASKKVVVNTQVEVIDIHGNANLAIKTNMFAIKGFGASDIVTIKAGSYSCTCPVVKDYSDVDAGKPLVRLNDDEVSIAINFGNFAEASGVKVGSPVTITLKERYGYLRDYQLRLLKKSDDRDQFASDEVFADFRPVTLGGIKEGRLYRSTSPVVPDARAAYAEALLEKNGVTAVINLNDSEERYLSREETPAFYQNIYDNKKIIFLNMGAAFASEEFSERLKDIFLFILDHPDDVIAIHGKEGRNRTGYVVAIISALCGANLEDINDDYMLSFENYYGVKKGRHQYEELAKTIPYLFSIMNGGKPVKSDKVQQVAEKYLKNAAGLTSAQIEAVVKTLKE